MPFKLSTAFSICVIASFSLLFRLVSRMLQWSFKQDFWPALPALASETDAKKRTRAVWKLRNMSTSLVHSTISGSLAFLAFYLHPELCSDMIHSYNYLSHFIVLFTVGYFIYDACDMIKNDQSLRIYELLFHHCVSVFTLMCAVLTEQFFGYATVALLMEVNSFFLHLRVLVNMHGCRRESMTYRVVSLMNIGTFVIFRIVLMAWMTRWLVNHRTELHVFFYLTGAGGLATMTVVNTCLFYRILVADNFVSGFWRENSKSSRKEEEIVESLEKVVRNGSFKLRRNHITSSSSANPGEKLLVNGSSTESNESSVDVCF